MRTRSSPVSIAAHPNSRSVAAVSIEDREKIQLVIDRGGIVRWKFIEVNYKIRPTNEMILKALEALPTGTD